MCWPELAGGVEVEERRPRTWNEPRRKRLNFVRSQHRESDEWMTTPRPRTLTQREMWDRRRAQEMEQRFMHPVPHPPLQGQLDPRMVQMAPAPQQLHHFQPGYHGHQPGFDQHGHHGHHGHHEHQAQLDRHSHHSEDDVIGIEDFGHNGHDGHDDHDGLKPRIIHVQPPKSHLPKGLKTHAKKSGGHTKKHSISSSSSDDCSSPDGSSGFSEGFRAGRRSLSRRPIPRGRSRSRLTDDSFEDLMHPRLRSRSRRGRW